MALVVSYIDFKHQLIPDKIMLPAIVTIVIMKFTFHSLAITDFYAAGIVAVVFFIPILFNMAFGAGDIRFGIFSAFFVGFEGIGYFIMCAALFHLLLLAVLKKEEAGFAPSMSLGALITYIGLNNI